MALTPSTMELDIGAEAPEFALPDTEGNTWRLADFEGKPLLVAFICNHCPYVVHLKSALADFGRECDGKGIAMVAVNANDVAAYPADAPDKMAADVEQFGYTFPYLYDESQSVARAYHAACTPDFFLFDAGHKLHYRGQFDASRAQQRGRSHRCGPARGRRQRARRRTAARGPGAQRRLQHQVEAGERTCLVRRLLPGERDPENRHQNETCAEELQGLKEFAHESGGKTKR